MILKYPIRVFFAGQETVGYDPYPIIREKLTDPLSGTVPETATISGPQVKSREMLGKNWKRSAETEC